MTLEEKVARALAGTHPCGACQRDLVASDLRDFAGVPVCVDCYRDLGLLTLPATQARDDEGLWAKLLSTDEDGLPPGPRRRFEAVERFASRMDPAQAERLLTTGARGGDATGLQEILWMLLAADALVRSGGLNGSDPPDSRSLALLLTLAARVGMDVAFAAMLDAGVATRSANAVGDDWEYREEASAAGGSPQGVTWEKEAFTKYIRAIKGKVDLVAQDAARRSEPLAIPAEMLRRAADMVLASIGAMEAAGRPSP